MSKKIQGERPAIQQPCFSRIESMTIKRIWPSTPYRIVQSRRKNKVFFPSSLLPFRHCENKRFLFHFIFISIFLLPPFLGKEMNRSQNLRAGFKKKVSIERARAQTVSTTKEHHYTTTTSKERRRNLLFPESGQGWGTITTEEKGLIHFEKGGENIRRKKPFNWKRREISFSRQPSLYSLYEKRKRYTMYRLEVRPKMNPNGAEGRAD